MKIWTLMENTACQEDLAAEHGLSLYIETGSRKILFDAGQTDAFVGNAAKMGVDLSLVDTAVLSHGHYDHSGGMKAFLEYNSNAKIYANQFAPEPHFNGTEKYIGIDPALAASERISYEKTDLSLGEGITLYSAGIPTPYGVESFGLNTRRFGRFVLDDFCHEQYLLIEEDGKRVLFSGCSHRGILNIVTHFRPDVLVGGFHFMKLDPEGAGRVALEAAARALLDADCVFYTGHCTGLAQYAFLKERMGDKLRYLSAGSVTQI